MLALAAVQVTSPDYTAEPFVIERLAQEAAFTADGTSTRIVTLQARIQSEAGVREFGLLKMQYQGDFERLEIDYVRVQKPDGSKVETPAEAVQDQPSAAGAGLYVAVREKHIPVRGLAVGDRLEVRTRHAGRQPMIPGHFWLSHFFHRAGVVLEETLRVSVPAGKYIQVASPSLAPSVTSEEARTVYTWTTRNPVREQPVTTGFVAGAAPRGADVLVTTFRGWDELGRWFGSQAAPRAEVTPAIQAQADSLTRDLATDAERLRAIYGFVSGKVRYIGILLGQGRYQPRSATEVLASQYGDCKDKHTLLAALLKATGYEAWPALIGAGMRFSADAPSPGQFNHVITVIKRGNTLLWLDASSGAAPFAALGPTLRDQHALIIPAEGEPYLALTPAELPFPRDEEFRVDATLGADGTLRGRVDITLRSDTESVFRALFRQTPPAQWPALYQNISAGLGFAGSVSNPRIDHLEDVDKPLHLSYDYQRASYPDWDNRRVLMPFPTLAFPRADAGAPPAEPFDLGSPGEIRMSATLRLPDGFSWPPLPGVEQDAPFATLRTTYSTEGGTLRAERRLRIKQSKVPPGSWPTLTTLMQAIRRTEGLLLPVAAAGVTDAQLPVALALQALQRRDLNAARDAIAQAARLNPRQPMLRAAAGYLALMEGRAGDAVRAFADERQLTPVNVPILRGIAQTLIQIGQGAEAVETLKVAVKAAPSDLDLLLPLADMLTQSKRAAEAIQYLTPALRLLPDEPRLLSRQSSALLLQNRKEEAVALIRRMREQKPTIHLLNDAAFHLAEAGVALDLARDCITQALEGLDLATSTIRLAKLTAADLQLVRQSAAIWDSAATVYQALGELGKAEQYAAAAWMLSQDATIGDRLARILERRDKKDAAIRQYELVLAANSSLTEVRERLKRLRSEAPVSRSLELFAQRTIMLPNVDAAAFGSAEYFVMLTAKGVEDVRYVNGSAAMKAAESALRQAKLEGMFPPGSAARIPRRGVLSCGTPGTTPRCRFSLILPANTTP